VYNKVVIVCFMYYGIIKSFCLCSCAVGWCRDIRSREMDGQCY